MERKECFFLGGGEGGETGGERGGGREGGRGRGEGVFCCCLLFCFFVFVSFYDQNIG